ncbi:MAG: hypothetical protein Q9160_007815 [Pyrenula sp. 1 TL-2023]
MTCNVRGADGKFKPLEVLLDTGSEAGNIIPYIEVEALGLLGYIKPSAVAQISGIGDGTMKIDGTIDIVGRWDGSQEHSAPFYVVDRDNEFTSETILGAVSINTFKLLRMRMTKVQGHGVNPKLKETSEARANLANREKMKRENNIEKTEADAKRDADRKQAEEATKVAATRDRSSLAPDKSTSAPGGKTEAEVHSRIKKTSRAEEGPQASNAPGT